MNSYFFYSLFLCFRFIIYRAHKLDYNDSCTSLVGTVFSYHIQRLKFDGTFTKLYNDEVLKYSDNQCATGSAASLAPDLALGSEGAYLKLHSIVRARSKLMIYVTDRYRDQFAMILLDKTHNSNVFDNLLQALTIKFSISKRNSSSHLSYLPFIKTLYVRFLYF